MVVRGGAVGGGRRGVRVDIGVTAAAAAVIIAKLTARIAFAVLVVIQTQRTNRPLVGTRRQAHWMYVDIAAAAGSR